MISQPTIFIIDDDAAIRCQLAGLLKNRGYQYELFASAEEFLDKFHLRQAGSTGEIDELALAPFPVPRCLLLDLLMPGMGGLELQQHLRSCGLKVPIVFISSHGDVPTAFSAAQSGAVEFLEKPVAPDALYPAVQVALHEDRHFRDEHGQREAIQSRLATLTPAEREVLKWLVKGKSDKQIAVVLRKSINTVKSQRRAILAKMQLKSVLELVTAVSTNQ